MPRLRSKDYMESFINPEEYLEEQRKKIEEEREREKRFPERPERDVLMFLLTHAPLERWERDVLAVIREEAYYFFPQMQTKIMNEGWASYWHSKIMTEKVLDASEIIDYADHNAGVMATSQGRLNPYKLGVELYPPHRRPLEQGAVRSRVGRVRLARGQKALGSAARARAPQDLRGARALQRRHLHRRISDARVLPRSQALRIRLVQSQRAFRDRLASEFKPIKDKLLFQLTNAGNPFIYVEDANFENRGELLLKHEHQGVDLRADYAKETLRSLVRIWKRPVSLATIVEGKATIVRFDGREHSSRSSKPSINPS